MNDPKTTTIAIIGSGFGGLGMAWELKQAGIDDFIIFEKNDDLGGTWRDNVYPGSGCDVPSHFYSYSWEPHYPWEYRYGKQAEILKYQNHVADKYDIRRHIQYGKALETARFDEAFGIWHLEFSDGSCQSAKFVVTAVGQLHQPAFPDLPGRESFKGESFHSANWNHDYDLQDKRAAVIGTGASAVQFVPIIAQQVESLVVFQRTPGWTIPKVDKQFSSFTRKLLDKIPLLHDLDRLRVFLITEFLGFAYRGHRWAEWLAQSLARFHLWRQVSDKTKREQLTPDFPVGCKRILLSNEWLTTLANEPVTLETDAVASINDTGITTQHGKHYEVDALIYGTGFKATEFLAPAEFIGLGGRSLREEWANGGEAYFGMCVHGYPNFFVLYGPNTNLGSGSIIYMLEKQQRYIRQLIETAQRANWKSVQVKQSAQAAFVAEMQQRTEGTTYAGDCQSWYKTADGRNTNTWVGSQLEFRRRTRRPDLTQFDAS